MWQAFVEAQAPYEKRRWIVENMVPEAWRDRVILHCRTVLAVRRGRTVRGRK